MIAVEVTNFQSIEKASINIDGFTALVGRSNIGKSALVRAIKAALTGAGGTSFVRHSASCARRLKKAKTCECYCTVHLRTEGFDLKWEKGDKRNRYEFNGQVYDRTNTGTPEFLLRPSLAQDFSSVTIARDSKLLQVADQFDNVFLLDQTGGVVADVLSDVARLDRINVAMRMVEKDRKEAASTRKVREKDLADLTVRVESYKGLDATVLDAQKIAQRLAGITKIRADVETIRGYLIETGALDANIEELSQVGAVTVPDPAPVVQQQSLYDRVYSLWAQASERVAVVRTLSGVEAITDPVLSPVTSAATRADNLILWVDRMRSYQDLFTKVKPVESAVVPEPTALVEAQTKFVALDHHNGQLMALNAKVAALSATYAEAEAEERLLDSERAGVFAELAILGVCPTCTQTIDETHQHRSVA